MSLPFESLNGVTAAGDGAVHDLESVQAHHHMVVQVAGFAGSGTIRVDLEVSLDGSTWVSYTDAVNSQSSDLTFTADGIKTSPVLGGNAVASYPRPARYVRASVTRYDGTITGGAVTAWIASC